MFQQLSIFFSFIFAIAFTHILASASALILARDRVRFSWLHALWMLDAAANLLLSWVALSALESLKHWSLVEVLLQLGWLVPLYFICSLISMKVPASGEVDMRAYYERQRPAIFSAFFVSMAAGMLQNFVDRNNVTGWGSEDWIGADLLTLPMLILTPIAGWSKSRWLQWLAVCISLASLLWFLVSYGSPIMQRAA